LGLALGPHGEARKLHEELRRRIGLRRSLLALVHRFKNRCEWHDAERLREIAKKAKRKKEDPPTAEFAKYLFDQGLDPLTRPRTADLEPDVLSFGPRSKLYVEAKQYRDENRSKIRWRIKDAAKQVFDTVGRLRGTVFEPWEAVLLVFRRGGPRCVLPECFACEGITVFLILVDIAPAGESGSRQKEEPIVFTEEELLPPRAGPNVDARAGAPHRAQGQSR
jgi:hypothetical protein